VEKVEVRQGAFRVIRFIPAHIIPPTLHTHFYLCVALSRRTNGPSLEIFQSV